ncbi:L-cysteine desulfidase family protein [Novisyntrophococcus fermenticellae]|uniref:L-cysteine desulfidase family protein n=1 Tax=Novisyntrophococcus fermenticellae TaxID=2068655 RepID=UPI001E314E79|nr:L-serine ammonia-lyase, iron-sulfur-dependent, subunit alpha [Novisyntrophococcus fermenticellae]
MTREIEYLNRLKSEIAPALGCTEPAAAALAAAYSAKELGEDPVRICLKVSPYIYKNGMNVGIPGTKMTGLDIASALGAVSAAPEKKLMVLNGISEDDLKKALSLTEAGMVSVELADSDEKIYIEAFTASKKNRAKAVISKKHDYLTFLEKNGEILYTQVETENPESLKKEILSPVGELTLKDIRDFAMKVPYEKLYFLRDVVRLNREIAEEGLTKDYGLNVGQSILIKDRTGLFSQDIGGYAVALTAAAADARMSGCEMPVMSAGGSGNQGLTATLPIVAVSLKLNKSEEETFRALAVSLLVTIHAKEYIGRLSVLCGCSIAAAIGSCCGIIFLFGGSLEQMEIGVNNMIADISGVVCDGAKPGCALKIATAVNSAIRWANMALNGIGAGEHDGIVKADVEHTLRNLGRLGNQGMSQTNDVILHMMLDR